MPNSVAADNGVDISVIIPLYNKEDTIERAIKSVLNQDTEFRELIIVDDGGTDRSVEIARKYEGGRVSIITQTNAGPGAARNRGVAAASASLIAFLDADDEWLPHHLRNAQNALLGNPVAQAYVCGYDAGAYRTIRPNKVAELGLDGISDVSLSVSGWSLKSHVDAMHSSCIIVRKSVFVRLGGFYHADNCRYGEDSYLWASVLFDGPIYWERCEYVIFHVEDSALGFATQTRSTARPLSVAGQAIRRRLSDDKAAAFDRLVLAYRTMDIEVLVRSGAFSAVETLRREMGSLNSLSFVRDHLQWAWFNCKRFIIRSLSK